MTVPSCRSWICQSNLFGCHPPMEPLGGLTVSYVSERTMTGRAHQTHPSQAEYPTTSYGWLRAARQPDAESYLHMWVSMEPLFSESLLCTPPAFCNTTCYHGWIVLTVNNRSSCHLSGFTEIPLASFLAIHVAWLPLGIWPPLWCSFGLSNNPPLNAF